LKKYLLGAEPLGGASSAAGSTFPRVADRSGYLSLDPFAAADPAENPQNTDQKPNTRAPPKNHRKKKAAPVPDKSPEEAMNSNS
jgi:hypothetical protein